MSHTCNANQAAVGVAECDLLIAAYILAGLAMMLNIRLSYSSAPYALIRFGLPENLFSVFVRRMASALELWCLPSMLLGNFMDLIQKLALNTDQNLKDAAGTGTGDGGKLRGLALALHTQANALHNAVSGSDQNAAKVLRHKAGNDSQKDDPKFLRKLASDLYNSVTSLSDAVLGDRAKDDKDLKQKAGINENDGLRKFAATLYEAANELANVPGLSDGKEEAQNLASEVGSTETESNKLRYTLKELVQAGEPLTSAASAVIAAYGKVQSEFQKVQDKRTSAYTTGEKLTKYEAVEKAWEAFNTLYDADLKKLAQDLKEAIGSGSESKLQKTLEDLGNYSGTETHQVTTKAGTVRSAYEAGGINGVKPKYDLVKAQQTAYQAIASIKPHYNNVVSAMDAFNNVYKPEELFMNAVGKETPGADNLANALKELGSDDGLDPNKLPGLAEAVKAKFEGFGPTVKSKFHLVQAQSDAYEQGGSIKTTEYKGLLQAWTAFNNKYYEVISSPKYNTIVIPSIITQWLNFLTYVILLIVYLIGGDHGHLTVFYFVIAISGVVFGINMTLVYSVDFNYIPVYIAGENSFPIVTSFMHYITTLMFGNRRKWNSDFIVVCVDIVVAIIISLVAAVVWTWAYVCTPKYASAPDKDASGWHHIFTHGFTGELKPEVISPFLMIVVGMGLVYAIYPGIAPGMIVPFYLIDKIEMVLLIATFFPPVIVACLRRFTNFGDRRSPMCKWDLEGNVFGTINGSGLHWHTFDLLMVIKITLAIIFIYSLHYRESNISRSIINQPKMSTALSIVFYMCHECLLAIGFPGLVGANGGGDLVLIPQYIGALFMIFLAFYSEGYIIEYKRHDPAHWPTDCMWYLFGS